MLDSWARLSSPSSLSALEHVTSEAAHSLIEDISRKDIKGLE